MKRSIVATSAFLIVAATCAAMQANAQTTPAKQHVLSRGLVAVPSATQKTALGKADHVIFGRIESIQGKMLSLRTRSGRIWSVDATEAIASGDYSAPLFIGKIVAVDGYLRNSRVLQATGVMRMGTLDRSTPPDR